MPEKDMEYYLNLDYDLIIVRVEDDGEFAYKAYSRDLDDYAFYGVGKTKEEALLSFEETKRELFQYYLENDLPIPEPTREPDSLPSGRFIVRTSPINHARLIDLSKRHSQSLNQYMNSLFDSQITSTMIIDNARQELCSQFMAFRSNLESHYTIHVGHVKPPPLEIAGSKFVEAA